ncbi:MAG: hypothetical protein D6797_02490 [Bdellovibrio sp.]|nr:MAG: hypothetical protein D6797_02490 [Bdellovibrio sp.]
MKKGILTKVKEWLIGKSPDIFDETGHVRHRFPDKKWQEWDNRFKGPEYNWKNHSGRRPHTN